MRVPSAIQFAFSPHDEQLAVAAIAARFFDTRSVCRMVGPNNSSWCAAPKNEPDPMIGTAFNSVSSCATCNNTIIRSELPEATAAVFDAMNAASEELGPGDLIAFRGGPALPRSTLISYSRVWWHAWLPDNLDYLEEAAAYIDPFWETRDPTTRTAVLRRQANAPMQCILPRTDLATDRCPGLWSGRAAIRVP